MIQHLPSEILNQIAELADPQTLLQVRLTSRRMREQSFPAFAAAFFGSITIDFCPKSVQRLRQIASHEQLRRHVRSIVFGPLLRSCPNPPRHPPGTGHQWVRHETARCLNPSQPIIAEICDSFSLLDNCRVVHVMNELAPSPEPDEPVPTSLCIMDAIHIALLAASRLPSLRAFRYHQNQLLRTWAHGLLPAGVPDQLGESWGRSLVDLAIECYSGRFDETLSAMLSVILKARSLRKLSLRCTTPEPFRQLTLAAAVPPLEVLELQLADSITANDLIAFTARFSSTLQHIHLHRVRTAPAHERPHTLERVCIAWVTQLPHLRSFGLRYLPSGTPMKMLTFNRVLDWEDPPGEGQLLFLGKRGGRGRGHIWGVSYAGPTEDARRVLVRIAEGAVAEDEETGGERKVVDATDWARNGFPEEYMVGGRLLARWVERLDAPELVFS